MPTEDSCPTATNTRATAGRSAGGSGDIQPDPQPVPLLGAERAEIRRAAEQLGLRAYYGDRLYDSLYRQRCADLSTVDVPDRVRDLLRSHFVGGSYAPAQVVESTDGTRKYLFATADHASGEPVGRDRTADNRAADGWVADNQAAGPWIEAVYIPESDRNTLCISTQVGCRMGCRFCHTARHGLVRNLSAREIVNQFFALPERDQVTNIVYMGMGEPLDNLEATLASLALFCDPRGLALGISRVTVSTVGVVPAMQRLYESTHYRVALSLHSPFPAERRRLIPIEARYPLPQVMDTIRRAQLPRNRRTMIEYVMLDAVNDSPRHLTGLIELLHGIRCNVNLIHYHPIPDAPFRTSPPTRVEAFRDGLIRAGITATIRQSRGLDIAAACGLLSPTGRASPAGRTQPTTAAYDPAAPNTCA